MIESISVYTWGWIVTLSYIAIFLTIMYSVRNNIVNVVIVGAAVMMIAFTVASIIEPYGDEIFARDLSINDTVITNHYADEPFIGTIIEMNRGLITVRNKDGIEKLFYAGALRKI